MTEQGRQAGRYAWRQRIAAGGMGEVWRADDTVLHREVAVKVLKPELADDARFRERFANEARTAATLGHPNIATVFDYGEAAGDPPRPYLVMELVRGRPLSDLIRPGSPMPAEAAVPLAEQTAQALAAAHAAGIVHRDIKPGNILVTPDRQVKVTDFGIARASDTVALTGTGEVLGTPHYLSPEQAEGRSATPASDVYSLGVVLFEMLAGRRPFSAETAVATALAHVRQPVPELPASVPPDLALVVRRALAKDPAQRFPDGAAFARALADPGGLPVVPDPAGAATSVIAPVADPAPTRVTRPVPLPLPVDPAPPGPAAYEQDEEDEGRGGRPVWPWLVGAAVLALIVLAFLLLRPSGDQKDPTEPATSPSATSRTVELTADQFVGLRLDAARAKLNGLGFDTIAVDSRDNPGDEKAGTVAAISPTGNVRTGTPIRLAVWGDPPEPTPTPSDTPSETPTPSDTPTATPTSASPTAGSSSGKGGGKDGGKGAGIDKGPEKGPTKKSAAGVRSTEGTP